MYILTIYHLKKKFYLNFWTSKVNIKKLDFTGYEMIKSNQSYLELFCIKMKIIGKN